MLDALTDNPHDPGSGGPDGFNPLDCGCLPGSERPWHIVRYTAGQHHIARPALHRLGVSTFLPLLRIAVPDKRLGRRVVTVPAFPGYVFAQWPQGFHWPTIIGEPGILGQSGSAFVWPVGQHYGHPAPVPEGFMADLLSRASGGGVIEDASVAPVLAPLAAGTPVRVVRGPFAGHTGLAGLSSAERVAVLFEIMGATRAVTARRRDVEAL